MRLLSFAGKTRASLSKKASQAYFELLGLMERVQILGGGGKVFATAYTLIDDS